MADMTHTVPLNEAPWAYGMFKQKTDGCVRAVIRPDIDGHAEYAYATRAGASGPRVAWGHRPCPGWERK